MSTLTIPYDDHALFVSLDYPPQGGIRAFAMLFDEDANVLAEFKPTLYLNACDSCVTAWILGDLDEETVGQEWEILAANDIEMCECE